MFLAQNIYENIVLEIISADGSIAPPPPIPAPPRFLSKLDASVSTCPLLENLTIVDTPGVLSGEMDQQQRAYDFADVSAPSGPWGAEKSYAWKGGL